MVLPMMISGDLSGEINIKSIEPDSFSRAMLREVSSAEIVMMSSATNPGMKKKELFISGLKWMVVFIFNIFLTVTC